MFIINIQDVQIERIPDLKSPNQKVLVLNYLNRQYVSLQIFPLSRLDSAQNLWRHLTDDAKQVCLIVKEKEQYSVWVENIQTSIKDEPPDLRLESVFRAQMYLIDGLLAEVLELLGQNQAEAFGRELLVSIPTIPSLKDLPVVIAISMQPAKSIDKYIISAQKSIALNLSIQLLSEKYLGKNYAKELLGDLQQQLPSRLKQSFQAWLLKQSQ